MSKTTYNEKKMWDSVATHFKSKRVSLSQHWSFNILNAPKRFGFVLSRYKFVGRMCHKKKSVLELGCSEGIGYPILHEFCQSYYGIDLDENAITFAKKNWLGENVRFLCADFLGKKIGLFDVVLSLDVIEHIDTSLENDFLTTIVKNLSSSGLCFIGTPNKYSEQYASKASKIGHINLFDHDRLKMLLERYFHNVFLFSMNDELIHTGFEQMSHYIMALACNKKL